MLRLWGKLFIDFTAYKYVCNNFVCIKKSYIINTHAPKTACLIIGKELAFKMC